MTTPSWLARRLTMPVTILERIPNANDDEYGNVVYDTTPIRDSVCFLQPSTEVELADGRAGVNTMLMHLPASDVDVVDTFSAFVVGGVQYEAIAPPAAPVSLIRPGVDHVEVQVQRSADA